MYSKNSRYTTHKQIDDEIHKRRPTMEKFVESCKTNDNNLKKLVRLL